MKQLVFVGAAGVLSALPLSAQSVLAGRVREDSTGRPLAGVEVVVVGSDRRTLTDGSGRYVLNMLPDGRRQVLFRSVGFRPVQEWVVLGRVDTVWANPMLVAHTVQLDPIAVTAKPDAPRGIGVEAFEERRARGMGVFFDSTEIRRYEHYRVRDFLQRVPGQVRRPTPDGAGACVMSIYIDGVWMGGGGAPGTAQSKAPPDLNREIEMAQVQAIEVYRGAAEVPVEYGGTRGACGVVLVWTRRGGG
jgi:hypothetical protein